MVRNRRTASDECYQFTTSKAAASYLTEEFKNIAFVNKATGDIYSIKVISADIHNNGTIEIRSCTLFDIVNEKTFKFEDKNRFMFLFDFTKDNSEHEIEIGATRGGGYYDYTEISLSFTY